MTPNNVERFEFESENAVEIARATLSSVDMDDVVRIAVEIEREATEPEPAPEPEPEPEPDPAAEVAAEPDGGDAATEAETEPASAESEGEPETDRDPTQEEKARQQVEQGIRRAYPIMEYLVENGPTLTLKLDQDLGYNASSSMTWLHKAGLVERETVSDGHRSWMYIYRATDRGEAWLEAHDEPEDPFPTEHSSPPRDGDLEKYAENVTGNEFED